MSLIAARRLGQALQQQALRPAAARGFAAGSSGDPLKADDRTSRPQQVAHKTDEATQDSHALQIRHAAEGDVSSAMGDVAQMAKNAAKGAKESAKLMADSLKEKAKGATEGAQDKP